MNATAKKPRTITIDRLKEYTRRNTPRGFVDACAVPGASTAIADFRSRFDWRADEAVVAYFLRVNGYEWSELQDHVANMERLLQIMAFKIKDRGRFCMT